MTSSLVADDHRSNEEIGQDNVSPDDGGHGAPHIASDLTGLGDDGAQTLMAPHVGGDHDL